MVPFHNLLRLVQHLPDGSHTIMNQIADGILSRPRAEAAGTPQEISLLCLLCPHTPESAAGRSLDLCMYLTYLDSLIQAIQQYFRQYLRRRRLLPTLIPSLQPLVGLLRVVLPATSLRTVLVSSTLIAPYHSVAVLNWGLHWFANKMNAQISGRSRSVTDERKRTLKTCLNILPWSRIESAMYATKPATAHMPVAKTVMMAITTFAATVFQAVRYVRARVSIVLSRFSPPMPAMFATWAFEATFITVAFAMTASMTYAKSVWIRVGPAMRMVIMN